MSAPSIAYLNQAHIFHQANFVSDSIQDLVIIDGDVRVGNFWAVLALLFENFRWKYFRFVRFQRQLKLADWVITRPQPSLLTTFTRVRSTESFLVAGVVSGCAMPATSTNGCLWAAVPSSARAKPVFCSVHACAAPQLGKSPHAIQNRRIVLGPRWALGFSGTSGSIAMIRVFLLDDHALVRTGYRLILQPQLDIEVVGEAATGEEGMPQIRRLRPDVVICDLHLPGISGLDVTERLVKGGIAKVVIVSVREDGPMPKRLLDAGASGYLGKACDADELLKAIREAARGRRYLAGNIAQKIALGGDKPSPFDQLSPRELEISMLFCQGMRAEDIARRLSLSGKTVATHKYRLFEKLGIKDTIALSRLAMQHGVSDPVLSC